MSASSGRNSPGRTSSGDSLNRSRGTKRGRISGTFTLAKRRSPLSGSAASTARDSERLEMKGKGCPGLTASGVSTGKTDSRKYAFARSCATLPSDFQSRIRMPCSARAGRSCRSRKSIAFFRSLRTTSRMRASCWRGVSPSGLRSASACSSCSCRPETRIM